MEIKNDFDKTLEILADMKKSLPLLKKELSKGTGGGGHKYDPRRKGKPQEQNVDYTGRGKHSPIRTGHLVDPNNPTGPVEYDKAIGDFDDPHRNVNRQVQQHDRKRNAPMPERIKPAKKFQTRERSKMASDLGETELSIKQEEGMTAPPTPSTRASAEDRGRLPQKQSGYITPTDKEIKEMKRRGDIEQSLLKLMKAGSAGMTAEEIEELQNKPGIFDDVETIEDRPSVQGLDEPTGRAGRGGGGKEGKRGVRMGFSEEVPDYHQRYPYGHDADAASSPEDHKSKTGEFLPGTPAHPRRPRTGPSVTDKIPQRSAGPLTSFSVEKALLKIMQFGG